MSKTCRVVIPGKPTVRAIICCLDSMKKQLSEELDDLDNPVVGFRIKKDMSWEISYEDE